jgi:hypothetical protein
MSEGRKQKIASRQDCLVSKKKEDRKWESNDGIPILYAPDLLVQQLKRKEGTRHKVPNTELRELSLQGASWEGQRDAKSAQRSK